MGTSCGKKQFPFGFKALSGLLLPDSGTIKVWGQAVGKNSFPSDFGCLIEHPGMLLQYSGMENLRLLASIQKKCTAEDISSLMLRLGLSPDDRRPVRKYSLGMRQKLGIIQAVMEKPKLVILDKPMNNLDAESIDIVRELISEMQAAYGITTIISSHNVEDCECQRKSEPSANQYLSHLCERILEPPTPKVTANT